MLLCLLKIAHSCHPSSWHAEGPGEGGKPQKTLQSPDRVYKAPTDNTKPQQTIQSPNTQYKAPETLHKHIKIRQKPLNIRQEPKIFNKSSNNQYFNIKYEISNIKNSIY